MPGVEHDVATCSVRDLDEILSLQLVVAWAGEGGEEPRLKWWRTDLVSEYGGEDLFRRLLPATAEWAVFQGAREAARRADAGLRSQHHDPDRLVSLFRLGFELDEDLDERLADLKRSGAVPGAALPLLRELVTDTWSASALGGFLGSLGTPESSLAPVGRRLKGPVPPPAEAARQLAAALVPLADAYPLPHYLRGA